MAKVVIASGGTFNVAVYQLHFNLLYAYKCIHIVMPALAHSPISMCSFVYTL